ncbi:MAG: PilZ domain-containing protein [Elusimicrobia bacterium]|nr:PilZ domain-containing protein [Elusimicrobiota bacterium]
MKPSERRKYPRIPIAADLAEPVEIVLLRQQSNGRISTTNGHKAHRIPAILANISAGGMALVAFGEKEIFARVRRIHLVANIPGFERAKIEGNLVHVRSREGIQTLGVRFAAVAKKLKDRIRHLIDDYSDCETRIGLRLPEVCTGQTCRFFNLCKKAQKLETP